MNWTQVIIDKFPHKSVYIVRDDNNILEADKIRIALIENGIAVITFNDPVHFRFTYENEFRNKYKGTLIIRLVNTEFEMVPWDIYEVAFQLRISISDIFPLFESKAIIEIPTKRWQEIFQVEKQTSKQLNYLETQQFIQNHIKKELIYDTKLPNEIPDFIEEISRFYKTEKGLGDWGRIAETIGKHRLYYPEDYGFEDLISKQNTEFQKFVNESFDKNLSMVSLKKPNYVNHIVPYMLRSLNKTNKRQALIVMDGMSFTQWSLIEEYLNHNQVLTETESTMAWVPSITSVSRQTIFSGKRPSEFPQSITTTAKEEKYWRDFWTEKGFKISEIRYQKSLGHKLFSEEEMFFRYTGTKIYGCVIDVIDEFMHGAKQGQATIQSELKIWLNRGYLLSMLKELLALDYDIYITSDHGNIEAHGVGQIQQGVLATGRGQRVRTYDDKVLRHATFEKNSEMTFEWESSTLPFNYLPLIARDKSAFVPREVIVMTHGGTHIEELFVPFVKVMKKDEA